MLEVDLEAASVFIYRSFENSFSFYSVVSVQRDVDVTLSPIPPHENPKIIVKDSNQRNQMLAAKGDNSAHGMLKL